MISEALNKLLACCREALAADGFLVCCEHYAGEERFRFAARDQSMVLELLYHDIEMTLPLSEANLRTKLMGIGLSADAVDAKIQMARDLAEATSYYGLRIIRFSK